MPVAHTVEAGEIRARLGGSNRIVDRHHVFEGGKLNFDNLVAELFVALAGPGERACDRRIDVGQGSEHADPPYCAFGTRIRVGIPVGACRSSLAGGVGDGGVIPCILPAHRLKDTPAQRRALRHNTDYFERRGIGNEAVSGNRAVGRLQAVHTAEGGRLSDRAPGVGAEGKWHQPRRNGCCRPPARPTGNPGCIPGVHGGAERGVRRGGAHAELVEIGFPHDRGARLFQFRHCGCRVRTAHRLEHVRATGEVHAFDRDVVFDAEGKAGERPLALGGRARGVGALGAASAAGGRAVRGRGEPSGIKCEKGAEVLVHPADIVSVGGDLLGRSYTLLPGFCHEYSSELPGACRLPAPCVFRGRSERG